MLKALLKKQMLELNKSFFVDRKTGKLKSKGSAILSIVLFSLLMIFVICGMFLYMSYSISPLLTAGLEWLYFAIMGATAVMFGLFGSVFNTYSSLYDAKDNDLLLSMPIPPSKLMAARLTGVYLMGLMYTGSVIFPAVIMYFICSRPRVIFAAMSVFSAIVLTVLVLILSCALGWVVAKIAAKLKNKSLVTVAVSLLFIGGYYLIYFKANEIINSIVKNSGDIADKVKGSAYPLYLLGRACAGEVLPTLLFAAITAALFCLTWRIMARSFIRLATVGGKGAKAVYKAKKKTKAQSIDNALLRREIKRFLSCPTYILNCALGSFLLLVFSVPALIKGEWLAEYLSHFDPIFYDNLPAVACMIVLALSSMNIITAPSVSLEGKGLWIVRSLPVTSEQILKAKIKLHMLFSAVPALICSICLCIALKPDILSAAAIITLPLVFNLLCAVSGLRIDLKMPNLSWANENAAIKQSFHVMLAMLLSMAYIALIFVIFIAFSAFLSPSAAIALCVPFTLSMALTSASRLKKKGVKRLEEM